ncbi:D-alanyl-D-alanine carboxypeptidase family protein [Bacillus sp. EB01]|uniref:D-alanyl-D-alanine carboxypeptidase family protein n=1 Tax=Bacillus sp. EB01 TaxID=1347086 RepID=UPI0005C52CC9|nr:D-alanyl-D-alanine carboxypeptidase family protein [Bacillus sp. EB01]
MKKVLFIVFIFLFVPRVHADQVPVIKSGAAIVLDAKSGEILFEKNSRERKYPASLTKVATAIYAIEKGNLDDTVTVSQTARETEGSRVYLEAGEQVSLRKLIEGLLINSGNDAGVAIAEHLDGSIEQFSQKLNEYLKEIGAEETTFQNPHGLFAPNHQTSARDLAVITQHALKNEEFRRIFGTKQLKWQGQSWKTTLFTHHKLLRERPYEGIIGGKTGYIDEAGHTLVTAAERAGTSIIVVTLKGAARKDAYNDTVALLDYAFGNFKTDFIPEGTIIPMDNGEYKTTRDVYFTQPANQTVTMKMNAEGTLEIFGEDKHLITSIKLENFKKETIKETAKENPPPKSSKEEKRNFLVLLPGTLVGILAFIGVFIIRIQKKMSRQNSKSYES